MIVGFSLIGRPAAPALLEVVDVTEDSVTLSWLPPHSDGGSRIVRYVVELCDVTRSEGWIKVREVDSSDRLLACVENLKEGKPYLFRVYAENAEGRGTTTEIKEAIVPTSQLGKGIYIMIFLYTCKFLIAFELRDN